MNSTTELSNLSYTNKDFNSIYVELLEYAKAISYKWDPTASDESDPGIVLLKLAALIGDKDNYNIDKSILELMPVSVTQPAAARQLFDQCGYHMKHYIAAEGEVNLTINKLPKDSTITEEVAKNSVFTLPMFTSFSDSDRLVTYTTTTGVSLSYKDTQPVTVMEGTPIKYSINNDENITLLNLDNKNRLYFNESNVAENGIFINNIGTSNFDQWKRVDNLSAEPTGQRCYKFGLTIDTQTCYIEFPEDAMLWFDEGINITYIKTNGRSGNIAAKKLKLLSDDNAKITLRGITLEATEMIGENNQLSASDCLHVTNVYAILNGRDPESIDDAYRSYKRVKDTFETLVSLKDYTDYMITSESASNGYVCDRLNDIQHSYKVLGVHDYGNELKTYVAKNGTSDKLSAFDLTCYALKFIPNVDTRELFEDTFTLIVPDSDGSIYGSHGSNVSRDYFESAKSLQHDFKTFETNKILLIKNKYPVKTTIIPRYKVSLIEKYQIEDNVRTALYNEVNSKKLYFGDPISYDLLYDTILNSDERIKAITLSFPYYETYAVYYDGSEIKELRVDSNSKTPTDNTEKTLWNSFRTEIFAKNVLKGVTPLYDSDNTFTYGVNQSVIGMYSDIEMVTTNTDITVIQKNNVYETTVLLENENLLLTCPSYVEENNFSSYVKIIYNLSKDITSNTKYELVGSDYIVFLWKLSDSDNDYTYVKYDSTTNSPAKIISPSFNLKKQQWSSTSAEQQTLQSHFSGVVDYKGKTQGVISDYVKAMSSSNIKSDLEVLTGQNVVKTYTVDSTLINAPCCWITNSLTSDKKNSILFNASEKEVILSSGEFFFYTNSERTLLHILGEGTRLTRDTTNAFPTCKVFSYSELMSEGIDYLEKKWILGDSITSANLHATEMEQILLGPGSYLKLTSTSSSTSLAKIDSTYTSLSNFYSIEYAINNGDDFTQLSNIASSEGWKVKSILNINCSKTKPQKIETHQTISLDGVAIVSTNPYYIQTDIELNQLGNIIDITNITDEKLSVFAYSSLNSASDNITYDPLNSATSLKMSGNKAKFDLNNFSIPEGNYILQITSDVPMVSMSITSSSVEPPTEEPTAPASAADSSIIVVSMPSVDVPSHRSTFLITAEASGLSVNAETDGTSSATLTIHPLFKYTEETVTELGIKSTLLSKIDELDTKKEFDYITDIDNPILNPLESESFCNVRHFYNAFTICEWQETDIEKGSDINVTTDIK